MSSSSANKSRGITLVELLVAMALSMLLLGGVATMFVSSRATYSTSERLARIEENGRFALDSIQRDLRGAGFTGCNQSATVHNVLNGGKVANSLWNFEEGIIGHNALNPGWAPTLDTAKVPSPLEGSDVLVMHAPLPANPASPLRAAMAGPTAVVPVKQFATGNGIFRDNQIVMVANCEHASIFEITKYDPQAGTIEHAISSGKPHPSGGPATSPGNAFDTLEWRYTQFDNVVALQTVIYYVREFDADGNVATPNVPTLYRRIDNNDPEPLVENVEMMQVRFGYDSDNDRIANDNVVPSALTTPKRIVSATVALLVRSPETYNERGSRTYTVLDTSVTKDDLYMRKVFTTTVLIRNTAR
jgi:type IV pilus assembly protein PilW